MPSVKTAISLPGEVFDFLDRESKATGKSRSEIVANALLRLKNEARSQDIRASYDKVYADDSLRAADAAFARRASHGVGRRLKAQDGGW